MFETRFFVIATITLLSLTPSWVGAIPEIQHWNTENGARVYFYPTRQLPMVDVQVVFDAGSARDEDNPGLSQLTNALLDSGTAELSADAVAERLDGLGALLDGGALRDMAWFSLRSLSEPRYLQPAVDIAAQVLAKPAFPEQALNRERNRMLAQLQSLAQSPDAIAERTFYTTLYEGHPYASPPEGTETSLKTLTRNQVQAFHTNYYVAANAVVAIVGDLDRSAAERLANTLVGSLASGEPAPPLPKVTPLTESKVIRVPHPSSQSHIFMGQIGMQRGDEDYYSLYLGNHILGGNGLVSKLAQEIRGKQGLSYSVYSYFLPMRQKGPFLMGLQTRVDQTEQATKLLHTTLQEFVGEGPNATLLKAAQQNITGGFALRIDSNSKLVQYLATIGFYRLPLDYLQTFSAKIEALSSEQVTEALQRRIQPTQLLTVIVGGP
jgi:zinc protease